MAAEVTTSWLLTLLIKVERRCQHSLLGPVEKAKDEIGKAGRDKLGAIRAVAGKMGSTVHSAFISSFIFETTKSREIFCTLSLQYYRMMGFISSCCHNDVECSQYLQMNDTTVVQMEDREKKQNRAELYSSVVSYY